MNNREATSYFKTKYLNIRARCKSKAHPRYNGLEIMSRQEWDTFLENTKLERECLYSIWTISGFKRALAPSVDRIDASKGYLPENCRWIPQNLNSALGRRQQGACRYGHPWSEENIYTKPSGQKGCVVCKKAYRRIYYRLHEVSI